MSFEFPATTDGKATVVSPSNIAFIKYWGARDLSRVLPENASFSMTLRTCHSRCSVEFLPDGGEHEVRWRGGDGAFETAPPSFADRVRAHLDRLRDHYGCGGAFRVATENSFPSAAGLASSASGFSALSLAVMGALGKNEPGEVRSDWARRSGSGSASRSVFGGYVQWPGSVDAEAHDESTCHAVQLWDADHWDLRDVIAVVEDGHKEVSSLEGHRRARTSPYFEARLAALPGRLDAVKKAMEAKDFDALGPVIEEEAIDLHCIGMTSSPAIYYWKPATLAVLEAVRGLRKNGVPAWITMDAGANVHVICEPQSEAAVVERLKAIDGVLKILRDGVGSGPFCEEKHLL